MDRTLRSALDNVLRFTRTRGSIWVTWQVFVGWRWKRVCSREMMPSWVNDKRRGWRSAGAEVCFVEDGLRLMATGGRGWEGLVTGKEESVPLMMMSGEYPQQGWVQRGLTGDFGWQLQEESRLCSAWMQTSIQPTVLTRPLEKSVGKVEQNTHSTKVDENSMQHPR